MDSDSGSGDERPGTGDQKPGTGDQKPGTGDQKPGTGDQKPGTGDWGLGTRRSSGSSRVRLAVESRVPVIVLLGGLPGVIISLIWLWTGDHGIEVRWTLTVVVLGAWLTAAAVARERVIRPIQTLSNL